MTEETKPKGKGCLIALGAVGVFLIIAYFGVMFFLNRAKTFVENVAEGVGATPEMIEEVKTLNRTYGFEPPADKRLSEQQVQTFISIKQTFADKIKSHEAQFKELDQRSQGSETGWREVTEGFKVIAEIRRDFLSALKKHGMSPKEYAYLTEQIYSGYLAAAFESGYEQMQKGMETARETYPQQIAQLEEQLKDPNLTEEMRQSLQASIASYRELMAQAESTTVEMGEQYEKMPKENIELLNKYKSELEQLNTWGFEYWGLALTAADYE